MEASPLLDVRGVRKECFGGRWPRRRRTFRLEADFRFIEPSVCRGVPGSKPIQAMSSAMPRA